MLSLCSCEFPLWSLVSSSLPKHATGWTGQIKIGTSECVNVCACEGPFSCWFIDVFMDCCLNIENFDFRVPSWVYWCITLTVPRVHFRSTTILTRKECLLEKNKQTNNTLAKIHIAVFWRKKHCRPTTTSHPNWEAWQWEHHGLVLLPLSLLELRWEDPTRSKTHNWIKNSPGDMVWHDQNRAVCAKKYIEIQIALQGVMV